MDKQEREKLKHDVFVEEVAHGIDYASVHKKQIGLYGGIAAAVLLIGGGLYFWFGKQAEQRQADLQKALVTQQAAVGPGSNPNLKSFTTAAEKEKAILKEFGELAAKYPGKDEAAIAHYYLGIAYADSGNYAEAEKHWQDVVNQGNKEYGSLARFSLAQMYSRQGKTQQAEQHLRYLADNPTTMVSKENAQIELAKLIAPTKPEEAKKILEPLRQMSTRNAVSRWAITAFGETKSPTK